MTDNKAPELKPCPFCGANAFLYRPDDVGCSSPDCWMSYKGRHVKPEEWNTRADLAPVTPAQAAIDRVTEMIHRPEPVEILDMESPNYFDPWSVLGGYYGSYDSAFDDCAIDVLLDIKNGTRTRHDLASDMFRETLCVLDLCDYGTSPRVCFPSPEFKKVLPKLVRKWGLYYEAQWGEPSPILRAIAEGGA